MALGTLNYSRMSDLAYQELRDAILSGQLVPASRLNQDELARRLGVSRAPVRDALNRLEADGLVKTLSRTGGVVVAEASEQEMVGIYELRAILDAASTRLACERMSDEDLARLRADRARNGARDGGQRPAGDRSGARAIPPSHLHRVWEPGAHARRTESLGSLLPLPRPGAQQRRECPPRPRTAPSHPGGHRGARPRTGP